MEQNSWYTSRWAIVIYHILFWTATLFLPYLVRPAFNDAPGSRLSHRNMREFRPEHLGSNIPPATLDSLIHLLPPEKRPVLIKPKPQLFSRLTLLINLVWVGLFYLNAYWLIGRYLYHKKILSYIGLQVSVFVAVILLSVLIMKWNHPNLEYRMHLPLMINLFPFLFVQACSLAYTMVIDKINTDKARKEMETEGLKTELSFLRSQISPHFIFNVLNNMVSLARKNSTQLEPSLIKLSGIMRYMLYESDDTRVLLKKEIDYLQSYIDLQTLRFGSDIKIVTDLQLPEKAYFIEPMLLIPFVENAFKHCHTGIHEPVIEIGFKVEEGVLHLVVKNNFDPARELSVDTTSGIGLANVKRRLNLLYAQRHSLLITEIAGLYTVSLQISLE